MPQQDFIGPTQTISKGLTYQQKDLYKYLMAWLNERRYDVSEREYTERVSPDGKRHYVFLWVADKPVSDYVKQMIELDFKATTEDVKVETHDGMHRRERSLLVFGHGCPRISKMSGRCVMRPFLGGLSVNCMIRWFSRVSSL